ncbi:MAG TPA: alpha/beta hydrolase, partial [Syntrophorhabdaceae bacterium]|nr:alpha/beta hydrolase [Syntrophorhabdaceae bacterium]
YPYDRLLSFEELVSSANEQIQGYQDIVVAESFSGPIAVFLIGTGRLKTKGLVLCATFAVAPRQGMLKMLRYMPLERISNLPFQRIILRFVLGNRNDVDALFPLWQRIKTKVPAKVLAHRMKMLADIDVRRWLPNLSTPCCYLQATRDRVIPPSSVHEFTQVIPDLRIYKVEAPHFIFQAEPEASATVIKEFINIITI